MYNYYTADDYDSQYLSQHGIEGQKWHIRNGPPYPLGSGSGSHRSAAEVAANGAKASISAIKAKAQSVASYNRKRKASKMKEADEKREFAKGAKEHQKQMKKGYHQLSDDELNDRISRLEKEKRYKDLVNSVYPEQRKAPGMFTRIKNNMLSNVEQNLVKNVSSALDKKINSAIDELINGEETSLEFWNVEKYMEADPSTRKKMAAQMTQFKNAYGKDAINKLGKQDKTEKAEKKTKEIIFSWDDIYGDFNSKSSSRDYGISFVSDVVSSPEFTYGAYSTPPSSDFWWNPES